MPKTKASFYIIAVTLATVVVMFVLPIIPKIPVSTAVIERGNLIATQSLEGLIGYQNEQLCISPLPGQVAGVAARPGQLVRKGDMVARLDTSQEEQALAQLQQAMHTQRQTMASMPKEGEMLQAVFLENQITIEAKINELMLSIEAKTLRAPTDGVVAQVYASEGAYVAALSPLLSVRSQQVELCATSRVAESGNLQVGMRAVVYVRGEQRATATLARFDMPVLDAATGLLMQNLHFSVDEGAEWLSQRMGQTVSMEILAHLQENVALAPIAAVSGDNLLWVIREGKVSTVSVEPGQRDEDYVRVPEDLVGEQVVLLPDESELSPGSMVKESKE